LQEHLQTIKQQVFERILNSSPKFFEHLVVALLLGMGYGYDSQAGTVTGRSHDGGIDGIISEDKLGLDLVYIQAKRYSKENKVGRKEIQAFIGAMEHIQKGVYFTTSSFTKEAETMGAYSRSGSTIRISSSVARAMEVISSFAAKDLPDPDTPRLFYRFC